MFEVLLYTIRLHLDQMQFLTRRIKSRLIGTIYLYFINAYTDAYLAERLDNSSNVSHFRDRIELLQQYSKKRKIPVAAFIYTQYYLNGLYDYAYAQLFLKLLVLVDRRAGGIIQEEVNKYKEALQTEMVYTEFSLKTLSLIGILLKPLTIFLLGQIPFQHDFSKRFSFDLHSYSPEMIVSGIMMVETLNIQNNHQMIQMIENNHNGESAKIIAIQKFISQFEDDAKLIELAIISTLKSASRWDAWFFKFLHIRFGVQKLR